MWRMKAGIKNGEAQRPLSGKLTAAANTAEEMAARKKPSGP